MNELEVIDIARDTIWTLVTASAPVMLIALMVGLLISLFQALTQIQEMTLSFVPKILAVFFSLIFFMPFMSTTINNFTQGVFERIAEVGKNDREMPER